MQRSVQELFAADKLMFFNHNKNMKKTSGKIKKESDSSSKKLNFLLNHSPIICFEVSLEGTILFVSPTIKAISGYSDAELLNRSMWNLYVDMNAREKLIETLFQKGVLDNYQVTLKDKSEQQRLCRIDAILLCNEQGQPSSLFGTFIPLD